jgi:type II secretory pathway pseudopilin PulG
MKVGMNIRQARPGSRSRSRVRAFTYIELMIASTVLLFVALALVSSNVSGARISSLVQQQTDGQRLERSVTALLKRDVAEARLVEVGTGGFATLTVPTNGLVGDAMRLTYVTSGVTNKRIYYWDNGTVFSCDNGSLPITPVLADVANTQPFTLVDPASVINGPLTAQALTNQAGRALVHVRFQLSTVGEQSFLVGPNTAFQGNEIRFFATQRGN